MTYFESFKAFVKTKPADEAYNSWVQDCAIGQWAAKEFTGEVISPGFTDFRVAGVVINFVVETLRPALCDAVCRSKTFGELSAKLERIA